MKHNQFIIVDKRGKLKKILENLFKISSMKIVIYRCYICMLFKMWKIYRFIIIFDFRLHVFEHWVMLCL